MALQITWKPIRNGKVLFSTNEVCESVECDYCGKIIPLHYAEGVFEPRNGFHDGRLGKYFYCRKIIADGQLVLNNCRSRNRR